MVIAVVNVVNSQFITFALKISHNITADIWDGGEWHLVCVTSLTTQSVNLQSVLIPVAFHNMLYHIIYLYFLTGNISLFLLIYQNRSLSEITNCQFKILKVRPHFDHTVEVLHFTQLTIMFTFRLFCLGQIWYIFLLFNVVLFCVSDFLCEFLIWRYLRSCEPFEIGRYLWFINITET